MTRPVLGPALALDQTRIRFGPTTLDFDMAVSPGRLVAVVGQSGSGKSTLLNLLAGFEAPESGRVLFSGQDLTAAGPADRPVSIVFQDHNLFAHLDVATNVGLGIHPALRLTADDRVRIAAALSAVGLEGFEKRRPPTLSGGERQRVALARALVRRRPILLLDEPFAALDPGLRRDMAGLIQALHRREGLTTLLVTHQPDDVASLADEVVFIADGKILLHEPATAFLARRDPPEVARFLGKAPVDPLREAPSATI
ncbi:ATP-binding cassette domain-containing protein [Rhizobium sp. YIM 134829]|uniref:thiamine ABC transporter ATP-binding protein n=1 Tax=Rhizobium sp. YIM 134829 TaxID=3390453 RepID=UPI00397CE895